MGSWEPEIVAVLIAASQDNTVVFDVGANIGASAVPILAAHPATKVVSFEPSPSVLPFLLKSRDSGPDRERWTVIPRAVTNEADKIVQFTRFQRPGDDVLEGIKDTGRAHDKSQIEVRTTTVDHEWDALNRPHVSLLKIDVEGAEMGVLEGSRRCLDFCRPAIVTEWCARNFPAYGLGAEAVLDFAADARYDAFIFPELTPVVNRRVFEYQLSTRENLLLVPREESCKS
jgi:FkbM family methyltransferase